MKVLILSGYGINCEDETCNAFKSVRIKGEIVHVNDLIQNPKMLKKFQILAIYVRQFRARNFFLVSKF